MKGYRIEGSHFVEFFERYENHKTVRTYVNIWCADDECFNEIADMIYQQGAHYIRAYHNAYTDGKGNAWNCDKWVTPEHFYKTIEGRAVRVDSFTEHNPSTTKNGINKTWMIESFYYRCHRDGSKTLVPCLLRNQGRNGKVDTEYIKYASTSTESAATMYMKKNPERATGIISMIDYLAI